MERPILFSGEMVRAILEGRKTQTRRVITSKVALEWLSPDMFTPEYVALPENHLSPYGYAGDNLWVRETWNAINGQGQWWHQLKVSKAERELYNWAWTNPIQPALQEIPTRWLPSIHMPRAASRITLEVVNVRVERLQDLSVEDAIAEGCPEDQYDEPTSWYKNLWNSINAERGYDFHSDPWVWVVEFKVV